MSENIKIVLADDHRIFRDGIKSILSDVADISLIGEVSSGVELIAFLKANNADVILLDITMPGLSGIETSKQLISLFPCIKILILSMHTSEEFVLNAIKAGAKGYLSKDTSKEELLEAIRTIYEGDECYSKLISESFIKSYIRKFKSEQTLVVNKNLTNREIEVLKLAAIGLTSKEIAEKLFISAKTADCHKNNIMQKLKLKNAAELALYAVKNNLIEL